MSIKTDCYWYDEWKDMNATFPCCKLTNDDILDSCDGCKHYHSKYNPTNADRIRAMTDEELAEFLTNVSNNERAMAQSASGGIRIPWENWLKMEAEDD